MPIYYTTKIGADYYVLLLKESKKQPEKLEGFFDRREALRYMQSNYPDAIILPPSKFQKELESRQVHTPDMLALLWKHGDLVSQYLCGHVVYGSRSRPIDGLWASIENAVYIQVGKEKTGYWSYACVPQELDKETIERYELTFVSRPERKEIFE